MEHRGKCNFLKKNLLKEVCRCLKKLVKEHHRSNTQPIQVLTNGLTCHQIKQPIPFNWGIKISAKFIEEAIKEGRE